MNDTLSTPIPGLVDLQPAPDLRADREERVAIDVVQQVHAEQDREREVFPSDRGKATRKSGRSDRRTGRGDLHDGADTSEGIQLGSISERIAPLYSRATSEARPTRQAGGKRKGPKAENQESRSDRKISRRRPSVPCSRLSVLNWPRQPSRTRRGVGGWPTRHRGKRVARCRSGRCRGCGGSGSRPCSGGSPAGCRRRSAASDRAASP